MLEILNVGAVRDKLRWAAGGWRLARRQRVKPSLMACQRGAYLHAMSQSVKLSDELVLDARLASQLAERSIGGQIELWAKLGRAIEPLLTGTQVLALQHAGAVKPLSACLATVDSPEGRRRVADHLDTQPFPHYQPVPGRPGMLCRIDADGRRTIGRFMHRRFKPVR